MNSEDDAEARIRELEQPLADAARASEASANPSPGKWAPPSGPPMPPPAMPYGGAYQSPSMGTRRQGRGLWILLALFVIGMIALPIAIFLFSAHQVTRGGLTTIFPTPGISSMSPSPSGSVPGTTAVAPPSAPSSATTAPAGGNITVSGINEVRTIACNGGSVSISGITNNVTITGRCISVNVSGIQNQVTVDSADAIQASGSGNHVTYHSGSPKVGNSGFDNVVQKG